MENSQKKQENIENAKAAEELFTKYLNNQKIPFVYVDQSKETFSWEFYENVIHRPDFIVYTKKGVFHIDVKFRNKQPIGRKDEKRFYINQKEIISLYNFQNELHSVVWIAFTDVLDIPKFNYASISEIFNYFNNISDVIKEKYPEEYYYFPGCWIHVPEELFYNHFSLQRGFYKEPDLSFIETEALYHMEKTKDLKKFLSDKDVRFVNYDGSKAFAFFPGSNNY